MFKKVYELFVKVDKPILGRWSLKTCNEISTSINSVYQNRDHRCVTPKKASKYKDNQKNAPVHETTHSN
jgi:hypothetical protein